MNMKTKGFTIVELLIVIVVIAILASISIATYRGVQNRARNTAALTLAQSVDKAAQLSFVDTGTYPSIAEMTSSTALGQLNASSFTVSAATPTTEKHVRYVQCGSPVIGAQITYRTFPTGTADIILGICS